MATAKSPELRAALKATELPKGQHVKPAREERRRIRFAARHVIKYRATMRGELRKLFEAGRQDAERRRWAVELIRVTEDRKGLDSFKADKDSQEFKDLVKHKAALSRRIAELRKKLNPAP